MFSPFSVPIRLDRVTLPTAMKSGLKAAIRAYYAKQTTSYTPYRDEKRTERLRNCRYLWFVRRVTLPTAMKSGLKETDVHAALSVACVTLPTAMKSGLKVRNRDGQIKDVRLHSLPR